MDSVPSLSKAEQAAVEGPVARNVSRGPQRPCSRARTCARDARGQHRRAAGSCPRCLSLRLVLGLQGQAQPAVGLQKALAHFLLFPALQLGTREQQQRCGCALRIAEG